VKRVLERLDRLQQRFPFLSLPIAVFKRFGEHGGGRLVTTISYWSFFSIFPLLLAFVAILNVVLRDDEDLRQDLLDGALGQVPVIGTQLGEAQQELGGSWVTIAIGVLAAIWAGLGAANALQTALDEIWDTPGFERPNGAVQRLRAITFLLILAVGLSMSTLAVSATSFVESGGATLVLGLVMSFLVNVAILMATFWLMISGHNSWRELLPGAVLAGAALVGLQALGRWVVTRYINGASDTYGTFAIVIALLSWFYLVSRVVLLSAELNAVLVHQLTPRSLVPSTQMTEGDRRAILLDHRRVERDRHVGVAVSINGSGDVDAQDDDVEVVTAAGS
jgi:YihY family inner membrane protein